MSSNKKRGISSRHLKRLVQSKCDIQSNSTDFELVGNEDFTGDIDILDHDPLAININQKLLFWTNTNNITHKAFTELRKILKQSGLDLPTDCRTNDGKHIEEHYGEIEENDVEQPTLKNVHMLLLGLHNQISELNAKVKTLERNIDACTVTFGNMNKTIFKEENHVHFNNFELPLQSVEEIDILNENLVNDSILNDFKTYIKSAMGSLGPKNLCNIFNKIITDEALLQYNWNGAKGKKSFIEKKRLCHAIYDAIQNGDFDMAEYENNIKYIIKLAHRRVHCVNFRKRAKKKKIQLKIIKK